MRGVSERQSFWVQDCLGEQAVQFTYHLPLEWLFQILV
jgi:hypothetical protein